VGAFIAMHGQPRDAAVEARVAIAGPVVGSLAAWAMLGAGLALEQRLLLALGHTAVLLNLFNLVPVPPLDGGRILTSLLPDRMAWQYSKLEPWGLPVLLLLLVTNVLDGILGPLVSHSVALLRSAVFL